MRNIEYSSYLGPKKFKLNFKRHFRKILYATNSLISACVKFWNILLRSGF